MLISASDPVAAVLATALDGLALRQKVTADNIANVDTPGFIASKVDFESSLKAAISDGSLSEAAVAAPTVTATPATPSATGNNVDLATEQMTSMRTTFSYQLLSRAVGDRYAMVSTAIGAV